MSLRHPLVREALLSAAAAASVAAALAWLGPPGTDFAAHAYQRTVFLEHGFTLWNNFWYAGRYSFVTYSLLYYPLAGLLGIRLLAVATIALAALAFAVVLWREWGAETRWSSRTFAVVWAGIVLSAAFPFALGMSLALLAIWALQAGKRWRFAALALLTLAASPLSFLLLVCVLGGVAIARRETLWRNWVPIAGVVAVALVEVVLWRIFPGGGTFPFSGLELAGGVAFCASSLVLTWRVESARVLRFFFAIYLAAIVAMYLVPSAIGENIARLRYASIPLMVLVFTLRRWQPRWACVSILVLAFAWNVSPLAYSLFRNVGDVTTQAKTWSSAISYLEANLKPSYRVEAVDTTTHSAAVYLADARIPARARLVPPGRLPAERGALRPPRAEGVSRVAARARRALRRAASCDARLQLAGRGCARAERAPRAAARVPHARAVDLQGAARAVDHHGARVAGAHVDDAVADRCCRAPRRDVPDRRALVAVLACVARLSQRGEGQDGPADDAACALRAADVPGECGARARRDRRAAAELHAALDLANDFVERLALRVGRPLLRSARVRVARFRRVAERQHDSDLGADDALGSFGVADPVRA